MASGEAWQAGWSLGSQLAAHQRQRKEALSDEAREKHLGEYDTGIGNLQKKYQSQLKTDANGNTVETPESLKTKYALTQAHLQRNAILNPQPGQSVGGKIGQKIGEVLHLAKKPEAQSTTVQPTEVSAPATGVTLAATPGFSTAAAAAPVATPAPGPAAVPAQGAAQPPVGVDTSNLVPVTKGMNKVFPPRVGYHLVSNPAERQRMYYQSDTNPSELIPATTRGVGNRPASIAAPTPAAQPASRPYSAPISNVVTQSFQGKNVPGMVAQGNIDITNRTDIANPDGSHSSLNSMSSEVNGKEVLYPGVGDGTTYPLRRLTQAEAFDQYRKTGKNLGSFGDPKSADAYAQQLHLDQVKYGNNPGLQEQANAKWGFLKGQNVSFVRKLDSPLPYQSETWAAGNAQSRPKEYPLNKNFVEQYKPGFTSDDYAAEVFSHIDPKGIEYSKKLLSSMDAPQIKALKDAAEDYKETIANGQPENEALRNASDAVLRGWIFGQGWTKKDFDEFEFDDRQKALLEEARGYALKGDGSPSRSSTMRQGVPTGQTQVPAQSTRTAYAPGTPEVALPPLEATLPAMQIGRPTTVRGPALNPAQLRAQAQANRQAQQETELSTAGAPAASLTPQQQAVQQAQAGTAGKMEKIRGDLDAIKAFHKDATPEQLKALTDAYLDKALGTTAPKEEKWTMVGKPYMKDGKAYFDEKSPTGEQRTSEWTGAPPAPPKLSAYQEQEAAFARTIGKDPSKWGEPETQAFLKMRYGAMQPLARARLAIADQTLHLNSARLQLAQAQNNMRDYLSVQKALTPFDKLKTTAERADEYVNNHNAEGDVALTLAFVDAIKPGTGFRFTDTERKWMVTGSRGVIDGAYAKINQGYTGETLTPEQRANMRNIIKQAAAQSDQQRNKTLAGFSQINPRVAKIAGGGNTPAPQQPKKGGGKTLADRLNDALGGK